MGQPRKFPNEVELETFLAWDDQYAYLESNKEQKKENVRSKKRKLPLETTSPTQSTRPFPDKSAPPAIVTEMKAPEFTLPTMEGPKISTEDPFYNLRETILALKEEAEICKTSKNRGQLEFLIKLAAHYVERSYSAEVRELETLAEPMPSSSTLDPYRLGNIWRLSTRIQQIVKAGMVLVPRAIKLIHQDLERETSELGILLISGNLINLTNWLDTAMKSPYYPVLPTSPAVPYGLLSTSPTVTPISTDLATPTTTPPPSTASLFSAGPLTSPPSPWTPTSSYSSTLFSPPPPYSPQLPAFLEEENEEFENGPPITPEQKATMARYLG